MDEFPSVEASLVDCSHGHSVLWAIQPHRVCTPHQGGRSQPLVIVAPPLFLVFVLLDLKITNGFHCASTLLYHSLLIKQRKSFSVSQSLSVLSFCLSLSLSSLFSKFLEHLSFGGGGREGVYRSFSSF